MSDLNDEILAYLDKHSSLDSIEYAQANNIDHQRVIGSIKSLQSQLEGVNIYYLKFIKYFKLINIFLLFLLS